MKSTILPLLIAILPSASFSEIILRKNGIIVESSLTKKESAPATGKALEVDPAGRDLLLFENGDIMHGSFGGINEGLLWERKDIDRPIRFGIPSVRQVVLKGGDNVEMGSDTSFFTLVSGDRIPGEIVSLDDESLVIKSSVVGDLTIPRAHIESISPNPFDGELFYSGPYSSDGWVILDKVSSEPKTKATPAAEGVKKADVKPPKKKPETEKNSAWVHSGASFYNLGAKPLVYPDAKMPDIGRLSFRLEWKGRLNLTLALHSDFTRVVPVETPENEDQAADLEEENEDAADEEKEPEAPQTKKEKLLDLRKGNGFQAIPWINTTSSEKASTFGTGYTMTIYSSYPSLSRNTFTEAGEPKSARMSTARSSVSLTEQGEARIEIRYDRKKALMMLYINGKYAAQWSDLEGLPGDGTGFGILNNTSMARIKVSEVMITSWNGMTDSAKSMDHPERDVALLTNGTDRFSGDLSRISDGVAYLKSDYLDAEIPVADISKIILKKSTITDLDADDLSGDLTWKSDPMTIVYQPFGIIKLNPTSAKANSITGTSPFLGKIKVDLKAASLLRFTEGSPDLSDWFDDL